MSSEAPDRAVLADFGLSGDRPVFLPGGQGRSWRAGDAVLKPVDNTAGAEYVAEVVARLPESDRVRVPRPVRTVAGGWVSHGWAAWSWLAGEPTTDRWSEVVAAGSAWHALLRSASRPAFLDDRDDDWAVGDRVAWQEQPLVIEHDELRASAEEFAAQLKPCDEAAQLVHGDLTGNVLLADGLPPAVIDMSCYWRAPSWALAVVAADALAWHSAAPDVVALIPGPRPLATLARATLYRLVTSDRYAATLRAERQSYLASNAAAYDRVRDVLRTLGNRPH